MKLASLPQLRDFASLHLVACWPIASFSAVQLNVGVEVIAEVGGTRGLLSSSGRLAMLAAIRRASSRVRELGGSPPAFLLPVGVADDETGDQSTVHGGGKRRGLGNSGHPGSIAARFIPRRHGPLNSVSRLAQRCKTTPQRCRATTVDIGIAREFR